MDGPQRVGQTAHVRGDPERESHDRGAMLGDGVPQALHRDVLADVKDVEPGALEDVGHHTQPEHMMLALDRSEQHPLTRAAAVPVRADRFEQAYQRPLADRCRQVLVGHPDEPRLPKLADPDHCRRDDERLNRLRRQTCAERIVDDALGGDAIAHVQRLAELPGHFIGIGVNRAAGFRNAGACTSDVGHERPSPWELGPSA